MSRKLPSHYIERKSQNQELKREHKKYIFFSRRRIGHFWSQKERGKKNGVSTAHNM